MPARTRGARRRAVRPSRRRTRRTRGRTAARPLALTPSCPGTAPPEVLGELVQEQPPDRLRGSRVPREERALHYLGQVRQREHRSLEVGEVRREARALLVGELLWTNQRLTVGPVAPVGPVGRARSRPAKSVTVIPRPPLRTRPGPAPPPCSRGHAGVHGASRSTRRRVPLGAAGLRGVEREARDLGTVTVPGLSRRRS